MNRRTLFRGLAAMAGMGVTGCASKSAAASVPLPEAPSARGERPDVLFIMLDDASPQRLGCYGNSVAKTPHIDRLAASGLRFDAAHCNSPVCNPSRVSMLTGLRPETSGVHMNNHDWRAMLPGVTTFMDHFKGHGYSTMGVGKIYHANYPDEDAWLDKIGSGRGLAPPKRPSGLKGPGTKHDEIRARGERPPPVPLLYGPSGLEDHEHYDARTATQVLKVYENPPEGPLFMAVGFHAPHLPLTAPQKYFDVFKDVGVTPPVNPPGDRDDIYHRARTYNDADFPREEWRDVLLAFHACQMFIDVQVGRVLDALEASGRADRTIVVLSSDHGFMLGEHDMFLKTVFFEECTRVPLLMRVPWLVAPAQKTSSLVELVDLMATVVDLCDLPALGGTDAISMRPLLVDPSRPWKKAAIQVFGEKRRSIVDGRWRLSDLGRRNAIELYDREADPREFHNLANDPAAAADKDRLMALLDAGWKACMPRV